MIKTALVCFSVCSLFLLTSPAPQATPASTTAETMAQALKPLVGLRCLHVSDAGSVNLHFRRSELKNAQASLLSKLDFVGQDFIRLSNGNGTSLVPISSINSVFTN